MSNNILDDHPAEDKKMSPVIEVMIVLVVISFFVGVLVYSLIPQTDSTTNSNMPVLDVDVETIDSNSLGR